jgi:hypothetical protein
MGVLCGRRIPPPPLSPAQVSRFGEVEELYVSDNLNDHLIGHV